MRYSTTMRGHTMKLIVLAILVVVGAVIVSFFVGKRAQAPSEQPTRETTTQPEQQTGQNEEVAPVTPNVNTQEFRLTASYVSCSTTTIYGVESRSCSGNIRVVPRGQADMEPGLYKINEQTKLLHNGVEQDLATLQELAQSNVTVRLKLIEGSDEDMLAEINY